MSKYPAETVKIHDKTCKISCKSRQISSRTGQILCITKQIPCKNSTQISIIIRPTNMEGSSEGSTDASWNVLEMLDLEPLTVHMPFLLLRDDHPVEQDMCMRTNFHLDTMSRCGVTSQEGPKITNFQKACFTLLHTLCW